MNTVLDHEFPQLVVLNGDLITGENTFLHNSTNYVDEIVAPLVQRRLLWASTYGNHDSDYNLSTQAILAREHRYPYSLTNSMVQGKLAGVSNYYLPVYAYSEFDVYDEVPEALLWFFDSRGGNYYQELSLDGSEVPQGNWVDESVRASHSPQVENLRSFSFIYKYETYRIGHLRDVRKLTKTAIGCQLVYRNEQRARGSLRQGNSISCFLSHSGQCNVGFPRDRRGSKRGTRNQR